MSRKSSKKHARRRARENALAILYSSDIIESSATRIVEEGLYPANDIHLSDYAEKLVEGVSEHIEDIDAKLMATSENWALDRMPVVDRAILRLAVYEMLYVDEVPVSVAINEAVELAKAYGGEDESSRFVNGVLGRISRLEDAETAAQASESDDADVAAGADAAAGQAVDEADEAVEADEADEAVEAAEPEPVEAAESDGANEDKAAGESADTDVDAPDSASAVTPEGEHE